MRTENHDLLLIEKMNKNSYRRRKEDGICVLCGIAKADEGYATCEDCREKQRIERKKTREFYRNMGICPKCGKNKLFGDEKTCPECLARLAITRKKSMKKLGKTDMDYFRANQDRLKKEGLCRTGCGRERAVGKTYCKLCLAKHNDRAKAYSRMKTKGGLARSERPSYGLCYTCGEPIDRDGRVCKKCAEILKNNLPEKRDNPNWRKQNAMLFKER